ncbi:endochitinase-like [Solanum tuberosum]|uniref:endochitinase-like n=1 Tax=Solanum tuberosum TaxID=4113 RepID=UPI0003D2983E|nr:PREDICTED: endochitinase-like [Solanum tuberosum]
MRPSKFTTFSLLFSLLLLTAASAQNCGSQAGGALCASGLCCSKFGWCGNTNDHCGSGNCQSQCPGGGPGPGPVTGGDLGSVISNSMFDQMLKLRNENSCQGKNNVYTYNAFITAARSFPGFGTTGDSNTRKREIAAFFAQTSQNTTGGSDGPFSWGYCFLTEQGNPGDYYSARGQWPSCPPGRKRGPFPITHAGPCTRAIGADLLNNPDLVATDPVISFKTSLLFWMTTQSPKPSCHDVIIGRWNPSAGDRAANRLPGFGVIANIINGGLECGRGNDNMVQDRIGFYRRYCEILGVSPGDNLDCGNQRPFGS